MPRSLNEAFGTVGGDVFPSEADFEEFERRNKDGNNWRPGNNDSEQPKPKSSWFSSVTKFAGMSSDKSSDKSNSK